jgi:chorismate mutase
MKLDCLRNKIDEIDRQLLEILNKRLNTVRKIAVVKGKMGLAVEDKKRESEILNKLIKEGDKLQLSGNFVLGLFKLIVKESKKIQKNII